MTHRTRPHAVAASTFAALLVAPLFGQAAGAGGSSAATPGAQQPRTAPQGSPGPQRGGGFARPQNRTSEWPAPEADDWAQPTLIQWQRTWDDALAVSRETGKPIMVAVNMDGEPASEHYAGVLYRKPEVAALFEPYVSVMASVYRHNPRDYDENGQRIPCSRFGTVTCGEHIALEPTVYSMFLDETRVAPRHIGVELDGTEMYDIFYAFSVKAVLDGIEEGISEREDTELPNPEKDLDALVASRSSADRVYIEQRFKRGGKAERLKLLEISEKLGAGAPVELLRLALFGLDVETAAQARRILAQQSSEAAIDLILEALSVPLPADEREMLVGALDAMGDQFPRARVLASTLRGLEATGGEGTAARTRGLAQRLSATDPTTVVRERYELENRLEGAGRRAREAAAADPLARAEAELARAEATLRLAVEPANLDFSGPSAPDRRRASELRFRDALIAAESAEAAGLTGWRTAAVVGLASHYLGRTQAAHARVRVAYEGMVADAEAAASETAQGWIGMAVASMATDLAVEELYRAARRRETRDRIDADAIAAVDSGFDLLAAHPLGTDAQALKHHDFLAYMGARKRAFDVLVRGIERFPGSASLHERLRGRLLWSRGTGALVEFYAKRKAAPEADVLTYWYSGLAGLVAGEFQRRRARAADALTTYEGAIADFRTVIELDPKSKDASLHYVAIAKASQGHARMELGDLEESAALLTEAFDTFESAADVLDGLNTSAMTTSVDLRAKLADAGLERARAALQARIDALPAGLKGMPAFEIPPDTPAARNRDRDGRELPPEPGGGEETPDPEPEPGPQPAPAGGDAGSGGSGDPRA
ncbi:MAG: hypothetical protein AAFU73_14315 [Planctomycetota bacterium]